MPRYRGATGRRRRGTGRRKATRKRITRRRKQAGGSFLPSRYDYPVTAKLPSGELEDPDSIPTVMSSDVFIDLTGADDDAPPPS